MKTTAAKVAKKAKPASPPRLGQVWPGMGGIYAGLVRGQDGARDYHLVVLKAPTKKDAPWQAAVDWAAKRKCEGHSDYTLPNRRDGRVLFANVSELFEKDYYWLDEQYAGNPDCAWGQDFYYGYQDRRHKSYGARARAVRRVEI